MKTYRVARNCHGYLGGYWSEGKIVTFDDEAEPPYHFEPVDPNETGVGEVMDDASLRENVDPMKPQPHIMGQPMKVKTGFAGKHVTQKLEPLVTASRALRNQKKPKKPEPQETEV